MSKKFKKAKRPPRAPRRTFRKLSRGVNEALSQVAAELDAMRRIVSAIVTATGCDPKVREILGMPPQDLPVTEQPITGPAQTT